jgi:putative ABC transport system permease protein
VAPGLKGYAPQVEAATRLTIGFDDEQCRMADDRTFSANIYFADSCLFDLLPRKILQGDASEVLGRPYYCMISSSLARKLGIDAVGKTFKMAQDPIQGYVIGGVFEDFPRNSDFYGIDVFISMKTYDILRPGSSTNWIGNDRYESLVRLAKGSEPEDIGSDVAKMIEDHFPEKIQKQHGVSLDYSFTRLPEVHRSDPQVRKMSWILSLLAFILLFASLMNYLLIVVGNMVVRSREMAVHKCFGASKGKIRGMILSETSVHLILSIMFAAVLLYCCKGAVEKMISAPLGALLFNKGSWILLVICLFVLLLGGLVPGIMYSSMPVASAFRGFKETRRKWKSVLLSVQFIAAGILFSLLVVVSMQYGKMVNADLGYDYSDLAVLVIDGATNDDNARCVQELERIPEVAKVSSACSLPIDGQSGNNVSIPGKDQELFNVADLYYVGNGFFDLMKIRIVQGRGFTENADSLKEIMVSRSFAEKMKTAAKWNDYIIGKKIMVSEHSDYDNSAFTICGVYDDISLGSFSDTDTRPSVIFYYEKPICNILVKFHKMDESSLGLIRDKAVSLFPDKKVTVNSYGTLVADKYVPQKNFRSGVLVAGFVILVISMFGLIGYVSDEVQRRRKEIAVRKVNGALEKDIFSLFFRNMMTIAVPSLLAGTIIAWFISAKWLMLFSNRISLNPLWFLAVFAILVALILGGVAINCYKIATSNPTDFIKDE